MIKFQTAMLRALLILAVAGLPTTIFAGGGVNIKSNANEKSAKISFSGINAEQVSFSIVNLDESVQFYSTSIDNPMEFNKTFDFSLLSDGQYLIIAKYDRDEITQAFSIKGSEVVVDYPTAITSPVFKLHDNTLIVFFENESEKETRVAISDHKGEFFEDYSSDKKLKKKYDLSNLNDGVYEVLLSNNNSYFKYQIEL